jgi:hypothetical protein
MNKSIVFRANHLINEINSQLQLDLTGLTILTDVGSNYYSFLPIIALKANAKKIFVWCSDSQYGEAAHIIAEFKNIISDLRLDTSRFEFALNSKPGNQINAANIVTNSFHIRPIDKQFISQMDKDAVISLMYEKWELRPEDVDVDSCKLNNIRVAGTSENHKSLLIFNAAGNLAQKMIYEAGLEIWQNKIFVWSNDHFGEVITNSLKNAGASEVNCSTNISALRSKLRNLDVLFLADYLESRNYFGEDQNSLFNIKDFVELNPNIAIVHLYGEVKHELLMKHNVKIYPQFDGKAQKMSFTLGHLGLKPIINLQAAGLKVGEMLYHKNYSSDLLQLF